MPKEANLEMLKTLFIPSLQGYKGTIVSIPLDAATNREEIRDFAEMFIFHIGAGCKMSIDYDKRMYAIWTPDGFGSVFIQLAMHRFVYEIRT
jgi:hypothetical protein